MKKEKKKVNNDIYQQIIKKKINCP